MTGVSTGQELCAGSLFAGFRDANATNHSKYFFFTCLSSAFCQSFFYACAFHRFLQFESGRRAGELYVLVMAMVGYGSVLLLVSCASLRSNGRDEGMLTTDYGSGSGFRAWIPYDLHDGVTDGGLRWMIPFSFYWRSTGGFPRFGYERFGHT